MANDNTGTHTTGGRWHPHVVYLTCPTTAPVKRETRDPYGTTPPTRQQTHITCWPKPVQPCPACIPDNPHAIQGVNNRHCILHTLVAGGTGRQPGKTRRINGTTSHRQVKQRARSLHKRNACLGHVTQLTWSECRLRSKHTTLDTSTAHCQSGECNGVLIHHSPSRARDTTSQSQ